MGLTRDMLLKIKEEIQTDPQELGYAGKTEAEITKLFNNSVFKKRLVIDSHPSPLNRILRNMADSPNVITDTEIAQAKITT